MKKIVVFLILSLHLLSVIAGDAAALRGRIAELEKENLLLREELKSLRIQSAGNAAKLSELEIAVAGILDTGEIQTPERREAQLLLLLEEISRRGMRLALQTTDLISVLRKKYQAMPQDSAERAAMLLKLEQLETGNNRFAALLKPVDTRNVSPVQILAVDRENRLAVIAVGSVHGIFPGVCYDVIGSPLQLRVIATRSFVSAAAIENGDAAKLNPGMRCAIREKRIENQSPIPKN
ncbi:MAG: hypothetical protein MJ033_07760 [Victivallaceae bacterium]|nr:hypothetical protein [Victivallaceae bacterium]